MFEKLYLIDKILGESMPLKAMISKCVIDSRLTSEVSIVDMGNGFSLCQVYECFGL